MSLIWTFKGQCAHVWAILREVIRNLSQTCFTKKKKSCVKFRKEFRVKMYAKLSLFALGEWMRFLERESRGKQNPTVFSEMPEMEVSFTVLVSRLD